MYKQININFNSDTEFRQQMEEHANVLHNNTLYGIDEAFNKEGPDAFIAMLKEEWLDNLGFTLEYFTSTEEYEKCLEVKQLIDK